MKDILNNRRVKLFFISLLVILPTVIFCILSFQSKSTVVKLNLEVSPKEDGTIAIGQKSLTEMKDYLNSNLLILNQDKQIEMYERERAGYLNIITILSIVLTVFSIFTVFIRFVEKDDVEKLNNEMKILSNKIKDELQSLKFEEYILRLEKQASMYRFETGFFLKNPISNEIVNTLESYQSFLNIEMNTAIDALKKYDVFNNKKHLKRFCNVLYNYIIGADFYCNTEKYTTEISVLDCQNNVITKLILSKFRERLEKEEYTKLKEGLSEMGSAKFEWGSM
jgi:hypothetical protein